MTQAEVFSFNEQFYLAFVTWREARGESRDAKLAVACSVLNRVHRPSWWGNNVESVATKKWQYSSLTDPRDPQLAKSWPLSTDPSWVECMDVAHEALGGATHPLPGADSYYDTSIAPPFWTASARFCGQIGRLLFFDVDRDLDV